MAIEDYCREGLLCLSLSSSPISKLVDDDLLLEFLVRLPDPESAWRCKSVWNSLISTPYFARRFVSHHQILSAGRRPLLISLSVEGPIWSFLPREIQLDTLVSDCSNDLLLLEFKEDIKEYHAKGRRRFLLCNPFTKQWVALPLAPERWIRRYDNGIARLVFEPSNSIALDLGDGEEAFTHHFHYRYSVVDMYDIESTIKLHVFYSQSGKWTQVTIDRFDQQPLQLLLSNSLVSLNGKLYWKTIMQEVVGWNPFLLSDHDGLPPLIDVVDASGFLFDNFLSVSQGALHMICLKERMYRDSKNALSVWKLEDEKVWTKYYEVSLKKLMCCVVNTYDPENTCILDIAGNHKERPEIIFLQVHTGNLGWVILSCDLKRESAELCTPPKYICRPQGPSLFQPTSFALWPTPFPKKL